MLFTSLFDWSALAVIVAAYWILPARWRIPWLAGSSLLLVAWNDIVSAIVLLATGACALLAPRWVLRSGSGQTARLSVAAGALLLPLLVFKFAPSLGLTPRLAGADLFVFPIGISYFTFKALMVLIDSSQGSLERPSVENLAAYLALAPASSAGPIDPPSRLLPQLAARPRPNRADLAYGALRITTGCAMKFLVADSLLRVLGGFSAEVLAVSAPKLLLFGPLYAIMIYSDFAGYSHIAIGAASLLGLRCTENFAAPYLKPNISEFWRSWHISLTGFLRRYVFLPLAYRWSRRMGATAAGIGATLVTFVLCGIWHGSGWNFVLWGGYHGVLLSAHQLFVGWSRQRRGMQRVRRTR
ncbi:MAG TPA: MBOAT family O-acyltransferase, partial [Terriglobales bacterium]|nr:MBOAT family O-acyltransferase [Terriglobales bacterium]